MPELVKIAAAGSPHFVDYTDPDALLTPAQTSPLTGYSQRTLDNKRCNGSGPKFIRLSSRCVRYRRRDVLEWVAERERISSARTGNADELPGRATVAHRLSFAAKAAKAKNTRLCSEMVSQAEGARRTLGMSWADLLGATVRANSVS